MHRFKPGTYAEGSLEDFQGQSLGVNISSAAKNILQPFLIAKPLKGLVVSKIENKSIYLEQEGARR